MGHVVETAFDGPSSLELAHKLKPDVVILDIGLPVMDGYQVASQLRRENQFQNTMVIAVTGYGQEEDRRRSREAGFDHHLVKPINHEDLLLILSKRKLA